MQKVSVKEFQRRIAELDAQYIIAQPKLARSFRGARLTLKRGTATPNTQLSDAEAQAKWNAMWGASTTGFKPVLLMQSMR